MKGQIVADFIVQHMIDKQVDLDVSYVTFTPWKLHFDGSACKSGYGVGIIITSPSEAIFEALSRFDHKCNNNQIEYEALLFGLQILHHMGVKPVEAYGDSLLRCVLKVVFILLEPQSPSRRIFISSHSLPPLWFAVSVLQWKMQYHFLFS
jgi:hypothetical protein